VVVVDECGNIRFSTGFRGTVPGSACPEAAKGCADGPIQISLHSDGERRARHVPRRVSSVLHNRRCDLRQFLLPGKRAAARGGHPTPTQNISELYKLPSVQRHLIPALPQRSAAWRRPKRELWSGAAIADTRPSRTPRNWRAGMGRTCRSWTGTSGWCARNAAAGRSARSRPGRGVPVAKARAPRDHERGFVAIDLGWP
jgi:hypothetical protein